MIWNMVKDELLQVRVSPELKERIRKCATEAGYTEMSEFIRDLIDGRTDANKWNAAIKTELIKILQVEPETLDEGIKHLKLEISRRK